MCPEKTDFIHFPVKLLSLYYFFKCTRDTQTLLYIEILTIPITPKGNCRRQLNVANAGCMLMYVDTVT